MQGAKVHSGFRQINSYPVPMCHCMLPAACEWITESEGYAGYGYYRPQMTLFDPGWRGEQTKGPEDWGVVDLGNDPMGIIDR